ncbi:MAG: amidase family protein [Planctomycetota bacterium]|jgi:Asp-tRNA(Asn)/Glu-tRNA(Gln) amidotransferase A subunit family amidase
MLISAKTSKASKQMQLARRSFLAYFSGLGLSATVLPGALWAKMQADEVTKVTKEMLKDAEQIAGLEFTDRERDLVVDGLNKHLQRYEKIREVPLDNSVAPAVQFNPVVPGTTFETKQLPIKASKPGKVKKPSDIEELSFWTITNLAGLIKSRKVSSLELTNLYLGRLKKYDSKLRCVITLTEELARQQAKRADKEIAAGRYRGPLHGIPWGAKDLLAVKGYKTTWGAMPYKDQIIDTDATVVRRLEQAGAVLVGKLTLGALAWGDVWFAGKTRNPWNTEKGSSGSSAGPAAATAAGLVGFSIGSETHGSIVSPCTVCGVTGLRPTFGRVSRYGAMALSWTMDKIGPMCRSVEDCALVFNAIYGPDSKDNTVVDLPFNWDASRGIKDLKVGYIKSAFEQDRDDKEFKANDKATLEVLRRLGADLKPIELPDYPIDAMAFILSVEAAAAFDELTRSDRDALLVRQIKNAWPNRFREARLVPAVEYIQANRLRTLVIKAMHELMSDIDVYVAPSWVGNNLLLTNLTGHPSVVLPNGFNKKQEPTSISFVGKLYGESEVLAVAKAYQDATGFHLKHPVL